MDNHQNLQPKFTEIYGTTARWFRAPGRVNLIGEHTDYNDGFVLPAAIEYYSRVGVAPRPDRKLMLYSETFRETFDVDLDDPRPVPRKHWADYPQGVALILERAGKRLRGANLLIEGDVPIGAGLSSSAALEVSVALALLANSDIVVDRVELAKLCQHAENEFVGARCGIMDQFASACGARDRALLLDCRSLELRLLPIDPSVSLVACNTMVKHEVAHSEYNTRRAECEEGVRLLSPFLPHIRALRDVTLADLEKYSSALPDVIYRRCRHIVTEDARVLDAATALETGNLKRFGELMGESHISMRDDFEISCHELDIMVEMAVMMDGVLGSRMTGGGFGGCTINLVRSDAVKKYVGDMAGCYERVIGPRPEIYVSRPAEGASEFSMAPQETQQP
jgi:galactokinase